jgi:peroxiredoxin
MFKFFYRSVVIVTLCSAIACVSKEKPKEQTAAVQQKNELPNMTFTKADHTYQKAKDLEGNVVLIFFQPECDHCQNEARQIREKLDKLNGYQVYFVSSAGMPEIQKFAVDYDLAGKENVSFVFTEGQSILDNYGPIAAPSIYVFRDKKLIQNFNGEVEFEVVTKYL